MVRQAAAEILGEIEAHAGLAAHHGFSLPGLRKRRTQRHPERHKGLDRSGSRESGRDQGADHRARRPGVDGQGMSHPRQVRRPDGRGRQVPSVDREEFSRARHPRAQRRGPAQARLEHGAARPRRRPDRGPDEPLQHDVRPLLHGREPGGLRPRAELGRNHGDPRQRPEDQAAPADVRAVFGRRTHDVAVLH